MLWLPVASPALNPGHTGFLEETKVELIEAIHLSAHPAEQLGNIGGHRSDAESIGRGIGQLMPRLRAIHQQFLGHATTDHAGSTHPIALNNRDPCAMAGRPLGGGQAAGPCPQDHQIKGRFHTARREGADSAKQPGPGERHGITDGL